MKPLLESPMQAYRECVVVQTGKEEVKLNEFVLNNPLTPLARGGHRGGFTLLGVLVSVAILSMYLLRSTALFS
jgi:type II secretory pathway component PulJ